MTVLLVGLALTACWLLWQLLATRQSSKLDMPQLQFEGDNSPARYQAETGALMAEGYTKVKVCLQQVHFASYNRTLDQKILIYPPSVSQESAGILYLQLG